MSRATLTIRDMDGFREIVVDCEHGTTTAQCLHAGKTGDPALIAAVVLKHYTEERCRCTRQLRKKYPPSLLPSTLWITK